MSSHHQRQGLNASEAALAWVVVTRGDDPDVLDGLDPDAASDLGPVVDWAKGLDADERGEVLDAWRAEDDRRREERLETGLQAIASRAGILSPRWQRLLQESFGGAGVEPLTAITDPYLRRLIPVLLTRDVEARVAAAVDRSRDDFLFEGFMEMSPDDMMHWFRRVGLFQFAEVLRHQGRRSKARVLRDLPEALREEFLGFLKRDRSLTDTESKRIREAFIAISRHHPRLSDQMVHLGMYFVAAAAGTRFGGEIGELGERLPDPSGKDLLEYYMLFLKGTRRDISRSVREAITEFARLEGRLGDEEEATTAASDG